MSTKQAMWVHGTSVEAEREGYFISRWRPAWGAVFRTHGSEWFHFAVPTPVIFDGQNSTLEKLFVLFNTIGTAKVTSVHVYDGPTKIQAFDGLALSGNHLNQLDTNNTWTMNPIHIKWGLGISVHVDFGPPFQTGVPEITFASAGADFVIP